MDWLLFTNRIESYSNLKFFDLSFVQALEANVNEVRSLPKG